MKLKKVPVHMAIILDGNGRWAQKRGKSRNYGHYIGVQNLKDVVKEIQNLGIKFLTLYCFSYENMNRPKDEVDYLMNLAKNEFESIKQKQNDSDINLRIIGEDDHLSENILKMKNDINEKEWIDNAFTLFIAFNYSSQREILNAAKKANDLSSFEQALYTYPAPPVDLLVRTSGEQRISNFLLYQISYAEIYFIKVYWPAFKKRHLMKVLKWYQSRKRNFGNIEVKHG